MVRDSGPRRPQGGRPARQADKAAGAAQLKIALAEAGLETPGLKRMLSRDGRIDRSIRTLNRWLDGTFAPDKRSARILDELLHRNGALLTAYYREAAAIDVDVADPSPTTARSIDETRGGESPGTPGAHEGDEPRVSQGPGTDVAAPTGTPEAVEPVELTDDRPIAEADSADPGPSTDRRTRWASLALLVVVLVAAATAITVWATNRHDTAGSTVQSGLSCDSTVHIDGTRTTVPEQQGTLGGPTYTDPTRLCGRGPKVPALTHVRVVCKLYAPAPASVKPDGFWYLVASGVATGRFAPANTFLNGDPVGAGDVTNTDFSVPTCRNSTLHANN